MPRLYIHPLPVRLWHWINAFGFVTLMAARYLASRLIADPDLVLILDAPEEIVITRKQEVAPAEIRRQRQVYRSPAGAFPRTEILNAAASSAAVVERA